MERLARNPLERDGRDWLKRHRGTRMTRRKAMRWCCLDGKGRHRPAWFPAEPWALRAWGKAGDRVSDEKLWRFRQTDAVETREHGWPDGRCRGSRGVSSRATVPPSTGRVLWEYLENAGPQTGCLHRPRFDVHGVARLHRAEGASRRRPFGAVCAVLAISPPAGRRIGSGFLTAQDRLVKPLDLARLRTRQPAHAFEENEYWPEWNDRLARAGKEVPNEPRLLTQDLGAIRCQSPVSNPGGPGGVA